MNSLPVLLTLVMITHWCCWHWWWFLAGVVDTGDEFFASIVDIGDDYSLVLLTLVMIPRWCCWHWWWIHCQYCWHWWWLLTGFVNTGDELFASIVYTGYDS
jgi:hypothetical protein